MLHAVARSRFVTWFPAVSGVLSLQAAAAAAPNTTQPAAAPLRDEPYTGPPTVFTTLFGRSPEVGGYVGPAFAYSRLDQQPGALVGLEACFLLDHTLAFGVAGNLWATETRGPLASDGAPQNLEFMYGGAVIRYAFFKDFLVYPSAGALIGAGSGTLVPDTGGHVPRSNTDTFFVLEPQLNVHSNVTRWLRITLQAGYRLAAGASRFGYDEGAYTGATLGAAVQIGRL